MEIEKTPPKMAKKLWNLVYYMTRKGISKSNSTLSCRSDNVLSSFISPREYEFSCSNSPAYPYRLRHPRLRNQQHHQNQHHQNPKHDQRFHRQDEEIVFDVLNLRDHTDQYPVMGLPWLGNSPLVSVRQLRVTDSPFAVNDHTEENHQIDRDAEKFIQRFYKDLRNQRRDSCI